MKPSELLDSPEKWTKGAWGRCKDGSACDCRDERATCWCIIGAIYKCFSNEARIEKLLKEMRDSLNLSEHPLMWWNDNPERTYEEVIDLLKKFDL